MSLQRTPMHRRRLIIALGCAYYVLQVIMLAYWHSLVSDSLRSVELLFTIAIAIVAALVDTAIVKYLLGALVLIDRNYADDVNAQLEESLREYRIEAEREDQLVQSISAAVEAELARAREALANGSIDEAGDHLQAGLDLASMTRSTYCDNVAVAAVLEAKGRLCSAMGVDLNARVTLPLELPINEVAVTALFFNLIDNALHECEKLREENATRKLEITVKSRIQAGQLFVEVSNPCRPGVDTLSSAFVRRDTTAEHHGWGIDIVNTIADMYHGIAEFSERDGVFVAQVMIPL